MKKINLVSIGYKILSLSCSIFLTIVWFCVCFLVDEFSLLAIVFSTFVMVFCYFTVILCFNNKILITDKKMIVIQLKKIDLEINDIIKICTSDELLNQNIIYISTIYKTYKITGYNTLRGFDKNIKHTKIIVKQINELLNLNN